MNNENIIQENNNKINKSMWFGPYGIKGMTYKRMRSLRMNTTPRIKPIETKKPFSSRKTVFELRMPNIFHNNEYIYSLDLENYEYPLNLEIGRKFTHKIYDYYIEFEVITKSCDQNIYLIARFIEKLYDNISKNEMLDWAKKIETILLGIDAAIESGKYIPIYSDEDRYDTIYNEHEEYDENYYHDNENYSDDDE